MAMEETYQALSAMYKSLDATIKSRYMPPEHRPFLRKLSNTFELFSSLDKIVMNEVTGMPDRKTTKLLLDDYLHRDMAVNPGNDRLHKLIKRSRELELPGAAEETYEITPYELKAYGLLPSGYWANYVLDNGSKLIAIDDLDHFKCSGMLEVLTIGPHQQLESGGYQTTYCLNTYRCTNMTMLKRHQAIEADKLTTVPANYRGSVEGRRISI